MLGIFDMFLGINPTIFNDPEFKEDSVRELVIAPILARLGYLPSGSVKVTRSKSLRHPFIRVGTRNHPVTTIPDYTFYVDDKPRFVLDAKSPIEECCEQIEMSGFIAHEMSALCFCCNCLAD